MKTDRILTGEVQKFFTTKSPMRDRIVDYVRENLDEGKKALRFVSEAIFRRCIIARINCLGYEIPQAD